jgi:hypothetical protein
MESTPRCRALSDRKNAFALFAPLLVAAVIWLVCTSRDAAAAPLTIEVDDAQNVTLSGSSDSLRSAVAELCRRGQINLVAYEAEDRPIAADYRNVPMADALGRLLRSEIYVAGLRAAGRRDQPLVTWLRVSGSKAGAVQSPPGVESADDPMPAEPTSAASAIDLGVAPNVIQLALTSNDSSTRERARRTIAETVQGNLLPLQRYLQRDAERSAAELAPFAYSSEVINGLMAVAQDVHERTQLQAILESLRLHQSSAGRRTFVR